MRSTLEARASETECLRPGNFNIESDFSGEGSFSMSLVLRSGRDLGVVKHALVSKVQSLVYPKQQKDENSAQSAASW